MDLLLINEHLGKEIFIGILTSITISIFFYIKYKVANRKVTNMSQAEEMGRNCEIELCCSSFKKGMLLFKLPCLLICLQK